MSALAPLYPRQSAPDNTHVYSWWNTTISPGYNGTDVEGKQSLDINEFFFQQIVANNIAVAAVTLYAWEYLSTLWDEYHLYRSQKFLSRHVILFLLVRYGTLPSLILPTWSVWHDFSNDPQGCLAHQQLAICVVQLIVSIVFAWRTISIFGNGRKIAIFLATIVCLQFGASFGLLWFSEEKLLPNGACMPVTQPNGFNPLPPFYILAFAFDVLTIAMSSYKLWRFSSIGRAEQHFRRNSVVENIRIVKTTIDASPLVQRLIRAGLLYFFIASSFNAVAFGLEISENIHSKALITLYAPLMCILCQRIILLDVKAIWGDLDGRRTGEMEQALVDRVLNDRRLSWEGSSGAGLSPKERSASATTAAATVAPESLDEKQAGLHSATIDLESNMSSAGSRADGAVDFQDMLKDTRPANGGSRTHAWRTFGRPNNSGDKAIASLASSSLGDPPSPRTTPQAAGPAASMSEQDRATALRLAGL